LVHRTTVTSQQERRKLLLRMEEMCSFASLTGRAEGQGTWTIIGRDEEGLLGGRGGRVGRAGERGGGRAGERGDGPCGERREG